MNKNPKNEFITDTWMWEEEEMDRGKPLHWLLHLQGDRAQHGVWEQAGGTSICLCRRGCLPQGSSRAGIDIKCEGWQALVECRCLPAILCLWWIPNIPKPLHCRSSSPPSSPYLPCIKRRVARVSGKGLWARGRYLGWILYLLIHMVRKLHPCHSCCSIWDPFGFYSCI